MGEAVRIRLSRKKGFDLQKLSRSLNRLECVSVARPGKWGNPYKVGEYYEAVEEEGGPVTGRYLCKSAAEAVEIFREWMEPYADDAASALRGKNLACWCNLWEPCHADVLLELANKPHPPAPPEGGGE